MMPVARECPACRAEMEPEQRFCGHCGHDTTKPSGAEGEGEGTRTLPGAAHSPQVGDVLTGKYRLIELLGKGGMGEVWRAEHLLLRRDYAIKFLAGALSTDPRFQRKFIGEARVLTELEHAGIVRAHDVGFTDEGQLYLVMDLVRGEPLRAILRRERRLSVEDTTWVAGELLSALEYAHRKGVVHRDLKPENVLVEGWGTPQRRLKVLDFGLAKVVAEAARDPAGGTTGSAFIGWGTLPYASPEQAAGEAVDDRSDLYSVGVMIYEMLAGSRPFDAESRAKLLARLMSEPPKPLGTVRLGLPKPLESVTMRALAKEPKDRPTTAGEMSTELGRARAEAAARQPGAAHPRRFAVWAVAAGGLLGGMLLVAAAAGLYFGVLREPGPAPSPSPAEPTLSEPTPSQPTPSQPGPSGNPPLTSPTRHSLTLLCDPPEAGSIEVVPPGDLFAAGTRLLLTPHPADGYEFAYWADKETSDPREYVMPERGAVLICVFELKYYRIGAVADPPEGGHVEPADEYVAHGDSMTVTASSSDGWVFTGWSDGWTEKRHTINPTADAQLVARFERLRYAISTAVEPEGAGRVEPASGEFEYGEPVTFTASESEGWRFDAWEDGTREALREVRPTAEMTLTARFVRRRHTVHTRAVPPEGGTFSPVPADVEHGASVTVTAQENDGYRFSRWSDGRSEATRTEVVTTPVDLVAEFELVPVPPRPEVPRFAEALSISDAHARRVTAVAVRADGDFLTSSADGTVKLWHRGGRAPVDVIRDPEVQVGIESVAFGPEGRWALYGTKSSQVRMERLLRPEGERMRDPPQMAFSTGARVASLAVTGDGRTAVAVGSEGRRPAILVYRLTESGRWERAATMVGHVPGPEWRVGGDAPAEIASAVMTADERFVVSGGRDGTVRAWDLRTGEPVGEPIPTGHRNGVLRVAVDPQGRWIFSAGWDNQVVCWDFASRARGESCEGPGEVGRGQTVEALAVSPDGRFAAIGGGDGRILVRTLPELGPVCAFAAHGQRAVSALVFAPDGGHLVSGGEDGSVRVWEIAPALR